MAASLGGPCSTSAGLAPGDVPLLFEQTEVSASMAALAHGTLVHALDYDDTYPDSVIHPSSVVVPAALAAGDEDQR